MKINLVKGCAGALLALGMGLASTSANGVVVSGSFTGTAHNVRWGDEDPGDREGAPITGGFRVDLDVPPADEFTEPEGAVRYLPVGGLLITLNAFGIDDSYGDDVTWSTLRVINRAGLQAVELGANMAFFPYHNATLTLAGPPGGLVEGNDLGTFHPGPIDLVRSSFSFFPDRTWGADVHLTSIRFDGAPSAPIPEPQAWLLMLVGLVGICPWVARKSKWPMQARPTL